MQVLTDLSARLAELHKAGYVHRDVKPANCLWRPTSQSWTLMDYGCCARLGEEASLSFSLAYAPPEAVAAQMHGAARTTAAPATDIWAFGVLAYEMLHGRRAFPPGTRASEVRPLSSREAHLAKLCCSRVTPHATRVLKRLIQARSAWQLVDCWWRRRPTSIACSPPPHSTF